MFSLIISRTGWIVLWKLFSLEDHVCARWKYVSCSGCRTCLKTIRFARVTPDPSKLIELERRPLFYTYMRIVMFRCVPVRKVHKRPSDYQLGSSFTLSARICEKASIEESSFKSHSEQPHRCKTKLFLITTETEVWAGLVTDTKIRCGHWVGKCRWTLIATVTLIRLMRALFQGKGNGLLENDFSTCNLYRNPAMPPRARLITDSYHETLSVQGYHSTSNNLWKTLTYISTNWYGNREHRVYRAMVAQ